MQRSSCSRLRWWTSPKVLTFIAAFSSRFVEAGDTERIEPLCRALQARASPLGHGATDGPGGSCTHARQPPAASLPPTRPPPNCRALVGTQAHVLESPREVSSLRRRVGNPVLLPLSYEGTDAATSEAQSPRGAWLVRFTSQ